MWLGNAFRTRTEYVETHGNPCTRPPWLRRTTTRGTLPSWPALLARHHRGAVA